MKPLRCIHKRYVRGSAFDIRHKPLCRQSDDKRFGIALVHKCNAAERPVGAVRAIGAVSGECFMSARVFFVESGVTHNYREGFDYHSHILPPFVRRLV
jgi:hypothetical protein